MGKFNHILSNFKTGEFSPRMRARTDLEEYRSSTERMLNVIPDKEGSANKRAGSEYISTLPVSSAVTRNIPFIFSKTESYVIAIEPSALTATVVSPESIEYIQDGEENVDSAGIVTPDSSRYHSMPASSFINIIKNDGTSATVTGDLGHNFDGLGNDAALVTFKGDFFYDPYPYEIYNIIDSDPRGFHYAQSADVLILTHISGTIPPLVIARTGEDTFEVEWFYKFNRRSFDNLGATKKYYTNVLRMPELPDNISNISLQGTYVSTHRFDLGLGGGAASGPSRGVTNLYDVYTLTATGDAGASEFFSFEDLGKIITIRALDTSGGSIPPLQDIDLTIVDVDRSASSAQCTAITPRYASVDYANNDIVLNSATLAVAIPRTDNWRESAWGNGRGYPRTCCFFEQRLIFGGSIANVDTIWGSQQTDIFKFLRKKFVQDDATDYTGLRNFIPSNIPEKDTVVDIFGNVQLQTDAISFKPSSQEVNAIQWLSGGQSLMVGTLGAEYVVSGSGTALSATSISFRRQTSRGGDGVMPVRIDDEVLYVLRDGRKINNFKFNRNNGSFLSGDITSHADHMVDVGNEATVAQYVQLEYCTSRDLVLAITDDNYLLGFTYSPQNRTMAWHRYEFNGAVLSVCSIPSPNGDVDDIWVTVLRNGVKTIEKVGIDFLGTTINDPNHPALFLDSHVSRVNLAAPETIDMSHLEDYTVNVYADGAFSFSQLLSSGNTDVELPISDTAIVGLSYEALIETNDLNAGGDFGSPIGNTQRIDRITGIFFRSMNVKVGKTGGQYFDPIPNMATTLVTGNKKIDFPAGSSEDGARVTIKSEDAFPMSILGLVARGLTSDR